MRPNPVTGEIWRHFKHDPSGPENNYIYEIMGIGRHSETEEVLVIYRPLVSGEYPWLDQVGASFNARPLEMFIDKKEVDGRLVDRFIKIK
ncbi:MAG: hypothetical protein ACI83D_000549 [Planctomycetota bacterium]|jgi:hypothetical protein